MNRAARHANALPHWLVAAAFGFFCKTAFAAEPGITVAAQASNYRYAEPGVMQLWGNKLGVAARFDWPHDDGRRYRLEGRLAGGLVDYTSNESGSDEDEIDVLSNFRAQLGRDWQWENGTVVTLLAGLGLRHLLNDSSGNTTTTGHVGYRRESLYLYTPLSVAVSVPVRDNDNWSFSAEYAPLLTGLQTSYLPSGETIYNVQRRGHGTRFELAYHWPKWSFSLFRQAWRIADSDFVLCDGGSAYCYEPHNNTREIGLQLAVRIR